MRAASLPSKKSAAKSGIEMFGDVPVLRRKWQGCNEVQGFLFSAARPAAEIAAC